MGRISLRHKRLEVPPRCADLLSVKWTRTTSLDKLAKKHKLKNWKAIWDYRENKALVAKRAKKLRIRSAADADKALQPGDVVVIPPAKADLERLNSAIQSYNLMKRGVVAQADEMYKRIDGLEEQIAQMEAVYGKHAVRVKQGDPLSRTAMDALVTVLDGVEAAAGAVPKSLTGPLDVDTSGFEKISKTVREHRRNMKGGTIDEAKLKLSMSVIQEAQAEIARLEKQIQTNDAALEEAGKRTIQVFCKEETVGGFARFMLKAMK